MNISLTPELERYVRRKVTSGLYNNASEVIREALRLLVNHEGKPARKPGKGTPPRKKEVVAALAAMEMPLRERGVESVALFGSVVRGTARADSDVDILIEIAPSVRFSLVDLVSVKDLLEDRLGRKVDVVMREGLDSEVRDHVLRESLRVF